MWQQWLGPGASLRAWAKLSLVCALFLAPGWPAGAASQVHAAATPAHDSRHPKLTQQQRALHALNRFTFGPRPGDVAAVRRMGLDAWFERQLHPEQIPDTALDARLDGFPAMQLTQAELIARFPSPARLRQYRAGNADVPGDPVEKAMYADAAFGYAEKKAAKTEQVKPSGRPRTAGGEDIAVTPLDPASVDALLSLQPAARMQRLVAMSPEQMQGLRMAVKGRQEQVLYRGFTPMQREEASAMERPEKVVARDVTATRLLRDVYSERQLQAVMADFWLNHFNVYLRKNQNEPYLLPSFEREVILPHALGRFENILVATAESPAMQVYLDNWTSMGPDSRAAERQAARGDGKPPKGINENYARELMELHTVGVNGGYTQQDVIQVARCFTGWTITPPAQGAEFIFNPNRHEPGYKTVLGHVIPESGQDEGLTVLHILATSPATAHLLSYELAQRFVSDTPPTALVNRMALAYLQSDGDIATVLRTMFRAREFWSPSVYRAKIKTPLEFVASALRASGSDVINAGPLAQALARLGMPLYGMQTPNGYSWQADAWTSSSELLNRLNFALTLSGNRVAGVRTDWGEELPPSAEEAAASSPRETEAGLETLLLDGPAAPPTRAAVLAEGQNAQAIDRAEESFRARAPGSVPPGETGGGWTTVAGGAIPGTAQATAVATATMAGLLLGSPDFQRR